MRLEQLRGLEAEEHRRNGQAQAVELLEALPVLPTGLLEAPEEILRQIFEWFQLQIRYDKQTNQAHVRVAISEETLDQVLSEGGASLLGARSGVRGGNVEGSHRAHVFGAPREGTKNMGTASTCGFGARHRSHREFRGYRRSHWSGVRTRPRLTRSFPASKPVT